VLQGRRVVAETKKAPNAAGMNDLLWNLRVTPVTLTPPEQGERRFGERGGQRPTTMTAFGGTVPADPGEYTVEIEAGGKVYAHPVQVLQDAWYDKQF
jgi:hypothetical protein